MQNPTVRARRFTASIVCLFAFSLTASASPDVQASAPDEVQATEYIDVQTVNWSDLVPAEGEGKEMFLPLGTEVLGLPDREEFESEEDYAFTIAYISAMRDFQPSGAMMNADLDGKTVRIPGYITPLGFEDEALTEFLLVPYLGACLHVPPPPANQIVYVSEAEGLEFNQLYTPIYVTGTLSAKPVSTILAEVGYTIKGAKVEPYTAPEELAPPKAIH